MLGNNYANFLKKVIELGNNSKISKENKIAVQRLDGENQQLIESMLTYDVVNKLVKILQDWERLIEMIGDEHAEEKAKNNKTIIIEKLTSWVLEKITNNEDNDDNLDIFTTTLDFIEYKLSLGDERVACNKSLDLSQFPTVEETELFLATESSLRTKNTLLAYKKGDYRFFKEVAQMYSMEPKNENKFTSIIKYDKDIAHKIAESFSRLYEETIVRIKNLIDLTNNQKNNKALQTITKTIINSLLDYEINNRNNNDIQRYYELVKKLLRIIRDIGGNNIDNNEVSELLEKIKKYYGDTLQKINEYIIYAHKKKNSFSEIKSEIEKMSELADSSPLGQKERLQAYLKIIKAIDSGKKKSNRNSIFEDENAQKLFYQRMLMQDTSELGKKTITASEAAADIIISTLTSSNNRQYPKISNTILEKILKSFYSEASEKPQGLNKEEYKELAKIIISIINTYDESKIEESIDVICSIVKKCMNFCFSPDMNKDKQKTVRKIIDDNPDIDLNFLEEIVNVINEMSLMELNRTRIIVNNFDIFKSTSDCIKFIKLAHDKMPTLFELKELADINKLALVVAEEQSTAYRYNNPTSKPIVLVSKTKIDELMTLLPDEEVIKVLQLPSLNDQELAQNNSIQNLILALDENGYARRMKNQQNNCLKYTKEE